MDEVQRAPELILALKKAVDDDRRPGRFLLTGSANLMTLPTVADSLAGRMETLQLLPLSQSEIHGGKANWIDSVFADSVPKVNHSFEHWRTLLATLIDLTPENARERRDRFGPVLETFVYGYGQSGQSSRPAPFFRRGRPSIQKRYCVVRRYGDLTPGRRYPCGPALKPLGRLTAIAQFTGRGQTVTGTPAAGGITDEYAVLEQIANVSEGCIGGTRCHSGIL